MNNFMKKITQFDTVKVHGVKNKNEHLTVNKVFGIKKCIKKNLFG